MLGIGRECGREQPLGLFEIALFGPDLGQVARRFHEPRLDRQCLPVGLGGLTQPAKQLQRVAEIKARPQVTGFERCGGSIRGGGRIGLAQRLKHRAQQEVRLGVIGRDGDRVSVGRQGALPVTQALVRETEVELRHEMVGRDGHHRLEGGLGVVDPALALAGDAKREAGIGEIGFRRERPGQ